MVFVVLQVGEGDLEDPALERVVGIPETARAVDNRLSDTLTLVSCETKEGRSGGRVMDILPGLESRGRLHLGQKSVETHNAAWVQTFTEYSSFLEKGSTVLLFTPFLPLDRRLFLGVVNHRYGNRGLARLLSNSHDCDSGLSCRDERQTVVGQCTTG